MTFFRHVVVLIILVTGVAVEPAAATARAPKENRSRRIATIDTALQDAIAAGARRARVIIRIEPSSLRKVKAALRRQHDAVLLREHPVISALTMDVPVRALPGIRRHPGVLSVSIDGPVTADADAVTDVGVAGTLLRETLGVPSAFDGSGVTVAVIDSGIQSSVDLWPRVKAFYDFTKGGHPRAPYDDHGHGTHVAGLIAGSGAASEGQYVGIAPKASLVGMKVLGADGSGYTSNVISAVEFAILAKAWLRVDIINLSLGHPPYESASTDPLVLAVERASAAGIVVLASAGNAGINPATAAPGYGGTSSPGNARSAITVGSGHTRGTKTRTDDIVGPYSSRGPTRFDHRAKPDLIAPGHRLIAPAALGSTLYVTQPSWLVATSTFGAPRYMRMTGTSMATAVTSGVVALMLQANRAAAGIGSMRPTLTPNAIKAVLQFTALPMHDEARLAYGRLVQGAGGINAAGALALSAAIDTSAPIGQPWVTASVEPFTQIDGEVLPWAQVVLWGDMVLWGDSVYTNVPAWGQVVLWGDTALWGDIVLWGDHVVQADILIWGDQLWDQILIWGDGVIGEAIDAVDGLR